MPECDFCIHDASHTVNDTKHDVTIYYCSDCKNKSDTSNRTYCFNCQNNMSNCTCPRFI